MDDHRGLVTVILKTLVAVVQLLIIAGVIAYAWAITFAFFSLQ